MLVKQISDLHNDISEYHFIDDPRDKETTVVIPGDIDTVKATGRYGDYLVKLSKQFKHVVFCAGNHEFYGGNILSSHRKINEIIDFHKLDNVHYLNDSHVIIDNVAFIGGTLWTNIKNPLVEIQVQTSMNDYKRIRTGPVDRPWARKLRVSDCTMMHYQTRGYMQETVVDLKAKGYTVVAVTHHAPSFLSVAPAYIGDPINAAYCSELGYWLQESDIDFWMHGHIHWHHDYMIGNCRVTCNPRGYQSKRWGNETTHYSDDFYLEIQ